MKTFSTIACGLIAAGIAAAPASAATVISLTGGTNTAGAAGNTYGNMRTFSAGGINVKAFAFSNNSSRSEGYLGQYGTAGLGITNTTDSGTNYHAVDNQSGNDFIMFVFDRAVNLSQAVLNAYPVDSHASADNDAFVSYATLSTNYASVNESTAFANALFTTLDTNGKNVQGNLGSGNLTNFNTGSTYANVWIIGAARSNYGNFDRTLDGFKLSAVTVNAVPEPATWAMMISGFGFIGAAMRRRRVTVSFAAA